MKKAKCKKCGLFKFKITTESNAKLNRYTYRDEKGSPWHGKVGPCCRYVRRDRDKITDPVQIKARKAEYYAKEYFESLGYSVEIVNAIGPDLTLRKNGKKILCEVKMAIHKKAEPNCYFVQPVTRNRRNDNLIAIVFPFWHIHVEPMKSHLSKCSKSGMRAVTNLIRNRSWIGAEECSKEDKERAILAVRKSGYKHGKYAKHPKPSYFTIGMP